MRQPSERWCVGLTTVLVVAVCANGAFEQEAEEDAVARLVRALEAGDTEAIPRLRSEVAEGGERWIERLRDVFGEGLSASAQSSIVQLLQSINSPKAIAALVALLPAQDGKVRPVVLLALSKTSGAVTLSSPVQKAVFDEVDSPESRRAASAIVVLGRTQSVSTGEYVSAWERRALRAITDPTKKDRLAYLSERGVFIQVTVRAVTESRSGSAAEARKRLMESEAWRTSSTVPWRDALRGMFGDAGVLAEVRIATAKEDLDREVRYFAVLALGRIGEDGDRALLRKFLKSGESVENEDILSVAARHALEGIDARLKKKD